MVKIVTLGKFEIDINGKTASDSFKKKTKLLRLLNLFILHRDKPLSVEFICEAIWGGGESSEKSLQNLIYRVRGIFADYGESDCIIYSGRTYMLKTAQNWQIDLYQMEEYMNRAADPKVDPEKRISLLQKVVDLYGGEYVLSLICEDVQSYYVSSRYRRIYSDAVCSLADMHLAHSRVDIVTELCEKAILLEPLEEQILLRLLRSLRSQGKEMQAISLIEKYSRLLHHETGMRPSEEINHIYEALKGRKDSVWARVDGVANELEEVSDVNNALFCKFETLKEIFRYESRKKERWEYAILLILAEIHGGKNNELSEWTLDKAVDSFRKCCMLALRKGDIFADYSKSQAVIMITIDKGADVSAILSRLCDCFYNKVKYKEVFVKLEIKTDL